ncbi:MAG: sialate O-acetylesterase [Verrucomicrobiota bacterium]
MPDFFQWGRLLVCAELAVAFSLLAPVRVAADHYTLFVCGGQSNMGGGVEIGLNEAIEDSGRYRHARVIRTWHPGRPLSGWVNTNSGKPAPGEFYQRDWKNADSTGLLEVQLEQLGHAGHTYELVFCWMQGESDAGSTARVNAYGDTLKWMLERLRADFHQPEMKMILGKIHREVDHPKLVAFEEAIRESVQNLADDDHRISTVETNDLDRLEDAVHLTYLDSKELGWRFFEAYERLRFDKPQPSEDDSVEGKSVIDRPVDLRLTELMYRPSDPESEMETEITGNREAFEYLELTNFGATPIDLTGWKLTVGVTFKFSKGAIQIMEPGDSILVVRNREAFLARHGSEYESRIAGEYGGGLRNGGERVVVLDDEGRIAVDAKYDNAMPWPILAYGSGRSLILKETRSRPDQRDPQSWRVSARVGGSPGYAEGSRFLDDGLLDRDRDGFPFALEYAMGLSDWENDSRATPPFELEFPDPGIRNARPTATYRKSLVADDLDFVVQVLFPDEKTWVDCETLLIEETLIEGEVVSRKVEIEGPEAFLSADRGVFRLAVRPHGR